MKRTHRFSLFTTMMAFVVLFHGILVVATEAGDACGTDWPFCNGSVIPDFSDPLIFIEYTHRIIAAMFGLIILANFILSLRYSRMFPDDKIIKTFAASSLFFLIATAGAGGMNVLLETPPGFTTMDIMAGVCLLGSLVWLTVALKRQPVIAIHSQAKEQNQLYEKMVGPSVLFLSVLIIEMVMGAFFKHSAASEVIMGVDLSERLIESLLISEYLYYFHAIFGMIVSVSAGYLLFLSLRFGVLVKSACFLCGLVCIEMIIGFVMSSSGLSVWISSTHMIVALFMLTTGSFIAAKAKLKNTYLIPVTADRLEFEQMQEVT